MVAMQQPSIFGQMPFDSYTTILLGFKLKDSEDRDEVTALLHQAALQVTDAFPFLAGQLVLEGRTSTNSGTYRVVPYPEHDGKSPVRVRDCTKLCPSYDEVVAAKAPFSMLDGKILSAVKGMFDTYDILNEALPVFILQANFVKGGLLLCFSSEHSCLDMNGQGQLIRLFAKACSGEAFTQEELHEGNQDTTNVFRFLEEGEQSADHSHLLRPSQLHEIPPHPELPAPLRWDYWRFSRSKLAELKRKALEGLNDSWVSTNDALLAFLLQRVIVERTEDGGVPLTESSCVLRAVNGRSSLDQPLSPAFMGHCAAAAATEWIAKDLVNAPLPSIAMALRKTRRSIDDHHIRSICTLLRDEPDRTKIMYGSKLNPMKDVISSSWAGLKLADCRFGRLGQAGFFRRPLLMPVPSLVYFMPMTRDGDIDIATSLFDRDVELLKADPVFTEYAEYIG